MSRLPSGWDLPRPRLRPLRVPSQAPGTRPDGAPGPREWAACPNEERVNRLLMEMIA